MARKISAGSAGGAALAGFQAFTTTLTSAPDTDIVVDPTGSGRFLIDGNAQLQNQSNLRFADAGSSNYVAFQAPASVPANYTWTLPNADGAVNQILTTNGTGTLTWSTPAISVANEAGDSNLNYPLFTTATSGTITTGRVNSTKLDYQPSTGRLRLLGNTASTSTTTGTLVVTGGVGISGQVTTGTLNSGNSRLSSLGVNTDASGTAGEIRATNQITSFFSSDIRFKENIIDIPNALATVKSIGGKLFDWTDEYIADHGGEDGYFVQKSDFGVIAQDVEKVFPRAVRTREDGSLAVDYEKLSALAFAAIVELKQEVDQLKGVK